MVGWNLQLATCNQIIISPEAPKSIALFAFECYLLVGTRVGEVCQSCWKWAMEPWSDSLRSWFLLTSGGGNHFFFFLFAPFQWAFTLFSLAVMQFNKAAERWVLTLIFFKLNWTLNCSSCWDVEKYVFSKSDGMLKVEQKQCGSWNWNCWLDNFVVKLSITLVVVHLCFSWSQL